MIKIRLDTLNKIVSERYRKKSIVPTQHTHMGSWERHCRHCSPSTELESQFRNLVAASPENWYFEVIDENGSNGNLKSTEPGTWFVGVFKQGPSSKTILMLTIAQNIKPEDEFYHYMVRVKADHNRCWKDWRCHQDGHMFPDQLNYIRDEFMEDWYEESPFDSMTPRSYRGDESITILSKRVETFDDAGDLLLEMIDTLES